jgi:hypothetical protein
MSRFVQHCPFGAAKNIEVLEDEAMHAEKIRESRQRLSAEYQHLAEAINRNGLATIETATETIKDEHTSARLVPAGVIEPYLALEI